MVTLITIHLLLGVVSTMAILYLSNIEINWKVAVSSVLYALFAGLPMLVATIFFIIALWYITGTKQLKPLIAEGMIIFAEAKARKMFKGSELDGVNLDMDSIKEKLKNFKPDSPFEL